MKVRLPARPGLEGDDVFRETVGSQVKRTVEEIFGMGQLLQIVGNGDGLSGYYRFKAPDQDLFVKIIDSEFYSQQQNANNFSVYCQEQGVCTSTIKYSASDVLSGEYSLLAYDWIQGAPFNGTATEMQRLGCALGTLHKVLKDYPEADLVREEAAKRHSKIISILPFLSEGNVQAPVLKKVQRLLKDKPYIFDMPLCGAQVIHGDLNAGNLRYVNGKTFFLDFEDARHSYYSPALDVAFCLERNLFTKNLSDQTVHERACLLLSKYMEVTGNKSFFNDFSLFSTLQWLSIRSVLMLKGFEMQGQAWPVSEWNKFANLLEFIDEKKELLEDIECSING